MLEAGRAGGSKLREYGTYININIKKHMREPWYRSNDTMRQKKVKEMTQSCECREIGAR